MNLFQDLSVLVLGSLLLRELTLLIRRRGPQRPRWFRSGAWLAAMIAIVRPDLVTAVARLLGIQRGADLVSYLAFLAMLATAFCGYSCYVRLQSQMTLLARTLAILQATQAPAIPEMDAPRAEG
jgi:small membrane protein